MATSFLPIIDLLIQDPATGFTTAVPSTDVKFYEFTDSTDSALAPDPMVASNAEGVLTVTEVAVDAGTNIRSRAIHQGMANYSETVTASG